MLKPLTSTLFSIFVHLGGFGLLILGVLDSSFLFMPLGNDLLVVAMTARTHLLMPYYAAMAAAGSVLGVLLVDVVVRRGGEEGLERHLSPSRLRSLKRRVEKRAPVALAMAAIMPPPFPFTPFIVVASALQYPRKKLLSVIAATRMIRFTAEGLLAIQFGKRILSWSHEPLVRDAVLALVAISLVGSIFSAVRWVQRTK